MGYDLAIRGERGVVTASSKIDCDFGVKEREIVALAKQLGPAACDIVATGKLVFLGGIEGHCHIEQRFALGLMTPDDFESAAISAAFGGNISAISFAAQHRGDSIRPVLETTAPSLSPRQPPTMLTNSDSTINP